MKKSHWALGNYDEKSLFCLTFYRLNYESVNHENDCLFLHSRLLYQLHNVMQLVPLPLTRC